MTFIISMMNYCFFGIDKIIERENSIFVINNNNNKQVINNIVFVTSRDTNKFLFK